MLERKAKLKIGLFCIAVALLLSVVMMAGCGGHDRTDKVFTCRVYAAQTLQIGDDPEMARVKGTPYYLLKLRWGINEPDEDNAVLIEDPVLGFGVYPPDVWEINNLDYHEFGTWSWYATLMVDGSLENEPILMAGYWDLDKELPQILEYRDYRRNPVRVVEHTRTYVTVELLDCGWDKSWDNKYMRKWADLTVTMRDVWE